MQPFETDRTLAQNPQPANTQPQGQPQAKPAYPQLERGPLPGQPQAQQGGYPTFQQGTGQPQPPNYQAPFPSQAYQQPQYQQQGYQQQGYPMYQQPNYGAYHQGVQGMQQAAEDTVQKQLLINQMRRNIKASGQGLVILYAFVLTVGAGAAFYIQTHQDSFQLMGEAYKQITGRYPEPQDSFSSDSCVAYMAGILNLPIYFVAFGFWHFLSICFAMMNASCCHIFHVLSSTLFVAVGVFISQQKCTGITILKAIFGSKSIPENAAPYYFALAGATFLACLLNCSWSSSKAKAERDQKNLSLMMAA